MIVACSALAGGIIVDSSGSEVGRIARILLEMPGGSIAFALIAHGGVFGLGESVAAVPWSSLAHDACRECFVLRMDRRELAPSRLGDGDTPSRAHM
jgi:sporulation protein YlmC with PRC-barrel domain